MSVEFDYLQRHPSDTYYQICKWYRLIGLDNLKHKLEKNEPDHCILDDDIKNAVLLFSTSRHSSVHIDVVRPVKLESKLRRTGLNQNISFISDFPNKDGEKHFFTKCYKGGVIMEIYKDFNEAHFWADINNHHNSMYDSTDIDTFKCIKKLSILIDMIIKALKDLA